MSTKNQPKTPAPEDARPVDLADTIHEDADQVVALLHMVKVFCTLEERDMRAAVDGTLSDAAEGLAILMGDLVHRVETIHDNVTKLEDLWARESAVRR
jgi:hypothetical protein